MDGPFRRGMLLSTLAFVLMGGWRWHQAATYEPDRIAALSGPGLVFVVRSDDCPDRRAAMMAWLARAGVLGADGSSLENAVSVVGGGDPFLDDRLGGLPRLGPEDGAAAGRALLRGGLEGTPAVLVVDERGYVVLAESFAPDGPGGRLDLVARLAAKALSSSRAATSETGA